MHTELTKLQVLPSKEANRKRANVHARDPRGRRRRPANMGETLGPREQVNPIGKPSVHEAGGEQEAGQPQRTLGTPPPPQAMGVDGHRRVGWQDLEAWRPGGVRALWSRNEHASQRAPCTREPGESCLFSTGKRPHGKGRKKQLLSKEGESSRASDRWLQRNTHPARS